MKALESILDNDSALPPGCCIDVSGESFTITLAPGTVVSRDLGEKGDGVIFKKATQNLYGFKTMALFVKRLFRFNQGTVVLKTLREAWDEAMRIPGGKVGEQLIAADPELAEIAEQLRKLPGPMREEKTARKVDFPNRLPDIRFNEKTATKAA
jgi:hypothetical protein